MASYRYCTNLATFTAAQIAAEGAQPDGLVSCDKTGGYFDGVDSNFLRALSDYKIGDPIAPTPDPAAALPVKTLAELTADGIVGCYTTLEAIMSPTARRLVGWGPEVLGPEYVAPA